MKKSAAAAVTMLLLPLLALLGTASSLAQLHHSVNGTLLAMRLDPLSNEIDSGTTAYRFPGAAAWELLTPSDAFFLANRAELVTARHLTAHDAGKTYELLAANDISEDVARIKISVGSGGDGPRFVREVYEVPVVENAPVGTEIASLDKDLVMRHGDRADSFRLERQNKQAKEGEEPVGVELDGAVIRIVTRTPIDYEAAPKGGLFKYRVVASDSENGQDLAAAGLAVRVLNEDDNLPAFEEPTVYYFVYNPLHSAKGKYPTVGRVRAADADGDPLLYRVRGRAAAAARGGGGCCIVVPQTGQVIVVDGEFNATVLNVDAVERDDKVS